MVASRSRGGGYTLVELLVVLAIVGSLGFAAVPLFARGSGTKVRGAAGDLLATSRLARMRAIATRDNVYIQFQVGGGAGGRGFYSAYRDLDGDRRADPGEDEASGIPQPDRWAGMLGRELPRGVRFGAGEAHEGPRGTRLPADGIALPAGQNRLGFYPKGNAGVGTIYLSEERGGSARAVRVLMSGAFERWVWRVEPANWERE